jgi:phage tail-like protein
MLNIFYLISTLVFIALVIILGVIIMQNQRRDPLRTNRFKIEIDGIATAGMCEVLGLDASVEVVEYREGTDSTHVRLMNGLTSYGKIIIKHGITDSMELYNWFKQGTYGEIQRKNIAIVAINAQGEDKARWEVVEAWPSKYSAPDFNAKGNDVAVETLEIVHEGIRRVS